MLFLKSPANIHFLFQVLVRGKLSEKKNSSEVGSGPHIHSKGMNSKPHSYNSGSESHSDRISKLYRKSDSLGRESDSNSRIPENKTLSGNSCGDAKLVIVVVSAVKY